MYYFRGMTFAYVEGHPVFLDCDLTANQGELTLIEGDNGSGKTTLLKLIGGQLEPAPIRTGSSGYVRTPGRRSGASWVTGNESVDVFLATNPRRFYYFPNDLLFPLFSVEEFLFLSSQTVRVRTGRRYRAFLEHAAEALERSRMRATMRTRISQLSSGNRVLLRFVNLYLNVYDVLLLDEPTGHLDETRVDVVLDLVRAYVEEKRCYCILSSHDPRVLGHKMMARAGNRFCMEDGKLVQIW